MAEEKFDGILLSIAQQCEGGVQEMLDLIFGFLARKTDFYASGLEDGKAEKLLIETFRRHSARAVKQAEEKKRRFEEMDRKKKERAEMERKKDEEDLKKR
jgi:hypothetical protein